MISEYYATLPLSDLAMSVNGVNLEQEILGLRISSVSGRDELDIDIDEIEIGFTNGSRYRKKRDVTRDILVTYALVTDDEESHKTANNKIKALLHGENNKFIFHDESDLYYVGNVKELKTGQIDASGSGLIASSGQITIHCCDPYKYSVEEKEVLPTADGGTTLVIDYKGTAETYPVLEATMQGDNGFVGYTDANEHILQFGNIDEADGENYKENDLLATIQDFFDAPDDVSGTEYMHPQYGSKGTLKKAKWYNTDFLAFGTKGETVGNANGGLRTIEIPADSQGVKGCKNFYCYFHILMYAALMGQTGEMCIGFLTADNKLIAGVNWYKTDCTGNTGHYELWANGKSLNTYTFQTSHLNTQNPWFWNWGHCDLKKEGSKLTFFYWGSYPSYTIPEVENMECAKIQIGIKQWGDRSESRFLNNLGVNILSFYKMNVEKWKDVPNKFADQDILSVDCTTGEVTLKGLPQYGLGALGNDWEKFALKPGINQIKCLNSEWAKTPNYKLKYREVYL